jgi:hypothetical protein
MVARLWQRPVRLAKTSDLPETAQNSKVRLVFGFRTPAFLPNANGLSPKEQLIQQLQ